MCSRFSALDWQSCKELQIFVEGFGSEAEVMNWTLFNRDSGRQAEQGDVLMVICITKPVSDLQQLEGFHSIYLKTLM